MRTMSTTEHNDGATLRIKIIPLMFSTMTSIKKPTTGLISQAKNSISNTQHYGILQINPIHFFSGHEKTDNLIRQFETFQSDWQKCGHVEAPCGS